MGRRHPKVPIEVESLASNRAPKCHSPARRAAGRSWSEHASRPVRKKESKFRTGSGASIPAISGALRTAAWPLPPCRGPCADGRGGRGPGRSARRSGHRVGQRRGRAIDSALVPGGRFCRYWPWVQERSQDRAVSLLHAAVSTAQAFAGITARPSGSSAPPSSNSTTPLHSRLHPCPGWLATALAALRSGARASGHRGRCRHACSPGRRAVPGGFWSAIAPPIDQEARYAVLPEAVTTAFYIGL